MTRAPYRACPALRGRRLTFEQLEHRHMLAGDVTAFVNGAGDAIVTGDGLNNDIAIRSGANPGELTIEGNGTRVNGGPNAALRSALMLERFRRPRPSAAVSSAPTEALERRVSELEAGFEALQDAVHRDMTRRDAQLSALERKTRADEIAKALSADARKRGLE